MEKLLFVKKNYFLTQGYGQNSYSHKYAKALDVSAKKSGDYKVYAPFSGYVAKVYKPSDIKKAATTIWLVSNDKILCADNKQHYVVMMMAHPKEILSYNVGDKFLQNDYLFNDGNTGNATGYHLHFEIAIYDQKEDMAISWQKQKDGSYALTNNVDPLKYMFLAKDTNIYNEIYNHQNYHFIYEDEKEKPKYIKGNYKLLYAKTIRKTKEIILSNRAIVKECLKDTKKILTSNKPYDIAMIRKGVIVPISAVYEENNLIWGKYGNCFIVLQNADGTMQAEKQ